MRLWARFLLIGLVVVLLTALPASSTRTQASPARQEDAARQKALLMLSKLTPEEKVGQLFIVTLVGTTFDENSQIYDLITKHHLGGVVLLRSNDNFSTGDGVLNQVQQLNRILQESEWKSTQGQVTSPSGILYSPQYIPLLIGISQEGDSFPNDQILGGLTQLPSLLSIGATWSPALAEQAGAIMGQELAALGFNLYLGPSLDVLDDPQMDSGEDLGVRTFGGDPYWVGKMGQAYINGLHAGSDNQLLVIAKHFPGRGGSDRSSEEEIATVRKSLEQLRQIELAPFFSVTGKATDPIMMADGLLVSHIRYQGFQGNIRATTRPVSSDAAALEMILNLPEFAQWRSNGGVMISDNLGSQAVRRFYDPTGSAFNARTAASEAFLAGNDLLYLDRFIASNDPDSYTTIIRTLDFFAQKYREDDAFAQRVDSSVQRILTLKYRLYPEFVLENVSPSPDGLDQIGNTQQVTMDVARRSVTLISPAVSELPSLLPRPPELRDRIVFLTDVQYGRQCSGCLDQVAMPVDALQNAVIRLYGPRAGGLVSPNLMSSYPFSDLWKYLNGSKELEVLEDDLQTANWVVVSMLKPKASQPDSQAFRLLLSERPDLLRNKRVIVFAFNAPFYLDATDISKLTAYYGMYSKTPAFVEAAAKILFQELIPTGYLPVSVPGVGYDLIQVTSPDPTQVIPLMIDIPEKADLLLTGTPEPSPAPLFQVGDIIPLHTGVIFDRNHNPVPDGTPVRFVFNVISQESPTQQQVDTTTVDGIARAVYRIERSGVLEIHAATEQGARSSLLRLDTVSGGVTVVPPTQQPTETPTLTPTPTLTVTPTVTQTVIPPVTMHFSDWVYALIVVLGSAVAVSLIGIRQAIARWGLRWALCGVIGGMVAYNYIALKMPGSEDLVRDAGTPGIVAVSLIGVLIGWGVGLLWKQVSLPLPRSGERVTGDRSPRERPATGPKSQSG